MTSALSLPMGWKPVEHPPSLFRRFEFESYEKTRAFLEHLAQLSKYTGIYPDLGFGRTHVNVTLHSANDGPPGAAELDYASQASAAVDEGSG